MIGSDDVVVGLSGFDLYVLRGLMYLEYDIILWLVDDLYVAETFALLFVLFEEDCIGRVQGDELGPVLESTCFALTYIYL